MALKRCIVFIVFTFLTLVCTVVQGSVEQTFAVSEQLWGSWECNEDNEFYLDINFETITYTDKKTGRYIVFPIISQYLEESSSGELYEGILKIGAPAVQTMPVNEINTKLHDNILFWQNYSGLKDPEYGYIFFSRNMDMLLFSEDKNPNDFFILNQEKEIDYLQKYTIRNYYENFVPLALIPVNLNEASDAVFHRISSIAPFKTIFEAWYGKLHEPSLDGCWYEEKAGNEDYYLDIDSTAITYTDVNSGEYVVYPYEQFYEYTSGGYQMTAIKLDPSTSQNIRSEDSFLRMLQSHSETGEYIYYTSTEDNKNMIFCWFAGRQSEFEKYITYTKILTAKEKVPPLIEPEEAESVDSVDAEESQSFTTKNKLDKPQNNGLKNISAKLHEWLKISTEKLSDLMKFLSELSEISLIILYLITVNIISFIMFRVDKYKAEHRKWRISEFYLILIAVIGGSIGDILGMIIFHHKTKKKEFILGVPIILLFQIMCGLMILVLKKLN